MAVRTLGQSFANGQQKFDNINENWQVLYRAVSALLLTEVLLILIQI